MDDKKDLPVAWADRAMFHSEPMPEDGTRVHLLEMTQDPLGSIAAACMMYEGKVIRDKNDVTDDQRMHYWEQVQKTHLKAPLEFIDFHFLIEGVTRSFTHQMVRQRTAVYAQESMRFAVKEGLVKEASLPPSLDGTTGSETPGCEDSKEEWQRNVWDHALGEIEQAYLHLVDSGMPAEDARGLLPHSVTTRLHYKTNLRGLLEHAGNRLCTQAQFEWRGIFNEIMNAIADHEPIGSFALGQQWQYETISGIFRPVCYQLGHCPFEASFDRHCSIRDRVQENARIGRKGDEWHRPFYSDEGYPDDTREPDIPAIDPAEWMMDSTSARKE